MLDAYLAAASNRLNEVMKVLTSIATVLPILTVVTGFFGETRTGASSPTASATLFWLSTALTAVLAAGVAMYFHRRGWL